MKSIFYWFKRIIKPSNRIEKVKTITFINLVIITIAVLITIINLITIFK